MTKWFPGFFFVVAVVVVSCMTVLELKPPNQKHHRQTAKYPNKSLFFEPKYQEKSSPEMWTTFRKLCSTSEKPHTQTHRTMDLLCPRQQGSLASTLGRLSRGSPHHLHPSITLIPNTNHFHGVSEVDLHAETRGDPSLFFILENFILNIYKKHLN